MESLIVERLKKYNSVKGLDERFSWKFNLDPNLFSTQERDKLQASNLSYFEKNIRLKEIIGQKANGSYLNKELNFWIINSWGGISTFKSKEENQDKIINFSRQLDEIGVSKGMSRDIFDTISSLSKVAAFVDPENFVIYDSRVIYSINWLLLSTSTSGDVKFFPMPVARNTKLKKYNLDTLINLKFKEKAMYYDHKTAYFEFCKLIKSLSTKVFDNEDAKPYHLEMLLFSIADQEIVEEIPRLVSIEIKAIN